MYVSSTCRCPFRRYRSSCLLARICRILLLYASCEMKALTLPGNFSASYNTHNDNSSPTCPLTLHGSSTAPFMPITLHLPLYIIIVLLLTTQHLAHTSPAYYICMYVRQSFSPWFSTEWYLDSGMTPLKLLHRQMQPKLYQY